MKISVKRLRQIIKEELVNEINAAGLPPAASDFRQVPSLLKGFNDLSRTYENALVMQGIVHNNQTAAQMSNQQLDQIAAQYQPKAKQAAQQFQQRLAEFLDDSFVEDLRGLSRGEGPRQQTATPERQQQAAPQPQAKPATGNHPDQRATIAPPRM